MKAFVTGLTGFVGPHLARTLIGKGCDVAGLGFRGSKRGNVQSLPGSVSIFNGDICDYESLRQILDDRRPDHVYHLAAISNVMTSFKDPRLTYDVNVGGTLNLFEALRELQLKPRSVQ